MARENAAREPLAKLRFPLIITVKDSAGAYVTSTAGGKRASSTSSAAAAAERLGEKLLGDSLGRLEPVNWVSAQPGVTKWRIVERKS